MQFVSRFNSDLRTSTTTSTNFIYTSRKSSHDLYKKLSTFSNAKLWWLFNGNYGHLKSIEFVCKLAVSKSPQKMLEIVRFRKVVPLYHYWHSFTEIKMQCIVTTLPSIKNIVWKRKLLKSHNVHRYDEKHQQLFPALHQHHSGFKNLIHRPSCSVVYTIRLYLKSNKSNYP